MLASVLLCNLGYLFLTFSDPSFLICKLGPIAGLTR